MSFFPFDRYIKHDELTTGLQAVAAAYPNLVKIESIGKSFEGRDIWCATVTNFATGPDTEKPAVWGDANIHATEVSPTTALTYLLEKLVLGYGTDVEITRALDTRAFYLVPRVNPDGAELYLTTGRSIRSSTRPYPFDEDALEGVKREDVNGDGLALQMRFKDADGPWKKDATDPRLMVRRDPTEQGGEYYRILPEGFHKNYDGVSLKVQGNKEGLDLNRNFPGHWRTESEQFGAGPYPTSEPEARALVAFITGHKNICHAVTFHTYSGVLLRPYGTQADDSFPAEDLWTYQTIGKKGTELTGYPAVSVFHDFKYHPKEVITGVFDDWCYEHLGIFAWTTEIWSPQRQAGITEGFDDKTKQGAFKYTTWGRNHEIEDDLKLLKWADTQLEGKGYYNWTPFDHPDLGPVEIGGWDMLHAFRNPPPQFLEREIAPFSDWLLWQALTTPRLAMHQLDVAFLGEDTWHVRLVVKNTGWLPSYVTKKALERKYARPVVAEITLPEGVSLVTGKERLEIGQVEGFCYKPPANGGYSADTTEDRAKAEWIVKAASGTQLTVTARHERAGVVRETVTLG
ncbi:M14 family metallopeptidase [Armatimonas sp.]|uniref:M14 family metallopeptidase n=1 Tax=Armatimonas sp. TaxID=1872638 RepID=UPI00374D320D